MKTDVANSQFGHFVLQHNKKGMPDTFFAFDQTWDFIFPRIAVKVLSVSR